MSSPALDLKWRSCLPAATAVPPDRHDHVEAAEIVDPPETGDDQEQAHGGDDACQDVPSAPEREEADGQEGDQQPSEPPAGDADDPDPDGKEGEGNPLGDWQPPETWDDAEEPESTSAPVQDRGTSPSDDDPEEDVQADPGCDGDDEPSISDDPDPEEAGEDRDQHAGPIAERDSRQAWDINLEIARRRRLATTFATVIGKIAEDLSGWPIEGDDEWDIQALMERRLTKRPLSHCRQGRERSSVVVILDTSGSCRHQSAFYSAISAIAAQAGDVDLYLAPNACLESRRTRAGWEDVDEYQDDFGWGRFSGRTIIFFGDFDGGDAPTEASRRNSVYWLSCEGDRYADMDEHNWCSYTLADFRGQYWPCETEDDFLRLAKRIK